VVRLCQPSDIHRCHDVKVAGVWRYVYRAVDQLGQVIDVLVSKRRDADAARRFFHPALQLLRVWASEVVTAGFFHKPAVARCVPSKACRVSEQRREAVHPAVDSDVIDVDTTFGQKFFHVTIGQPEAKIPAHRHGDHLDREPASRERGWGVRMQDAVESRACGSAISIEPWSDDLSDVAWNLAAASNRAADDR